MPEEKALFAGVYEEIRCMTRNAGQSRQAFDGDATTFYVGLRSCGHDPPTRTRDYPPSRIHARPQATHANVRFCNLPGCLSVNHPDTRIKTAL